MNIDLEKSGPRVQPCGATDSIAAERVYFSSLLSINCSLWSCNMFKNHFPVSNWQGWVLEVCLNH